MYSTDGVTWTTVEFNVFDDLSLRGITYGAGRFVAVGSPDNWTDDGRKTSNDGIIAYSNVQEQGAVICLNTPTQLQ